ncbi:MAG TPA: peptidylprolyl isomerase [Bacteroidetes bacterium]|nr:peptidylprolyl isomerase [Bacteroidota bacterium]
MLFGCSKDKSKNETKKVVEAKGTTSLEFSYKNPSEAELSKIAPEIFQVEFKTGKGSFIIEAHRSWSPHGVDRFYNLVRSGYFKDVRFFRVMENFMAQFGAHGDPQVAQAWGAFNIPDEPAKQSNLRGFVTFAKSNRPNSRTTQLFINYRDNSFLDTQGFAPIGKVVQGMEVVDNLYSGYGEGAPRGNGPNQGRISAEGNAYLEAEFPQLDYIIDTKIIKK